MPDALLSFVGFATVKCGGTMRFALLAAGMLASLSAPALAQNVTAKDPAGFATALVGLGYKPGAVTSNDGIPFLQADIDDWPTLFGFGACEEGRNCRYMILTSAILDIKDPPQAWINEINDDLDLAKVVLGDDKGVLVRLAVPLGEDGIPVTTLRYALYQWRASIQAVAQSAIDKKLVQQ